MMSFYNSSSCLEDECFCTQAIYTPEVSMPARAVRRKLLALPPALIITWGTDVKPARSWGMFRLFGEKTLFFKLFPKKYLAPSRMNASVGLRVARIKPWGQLCRAMSCPSPTPSVVNSLQRKKKMASEAFLAELEAARPEIHLGLSTSLELLARCKPALCNPDPALRIRASGRARRA